MRLARQPRAIQRTALFVLLLLCAGPREGWAARDTLWNIVHDQCVPGQRRGDPGPCAKVGTAGGEDASYAVLKDRNGVAQFLLIPTARVAGIQDPAVIAPDAPNWFDPAWRARTYVERVLGRTLPRDGVSLVVNSVPALSQDQLHIHVDCTKPEVRDALRQHLDQVGPRWAPFPVPLAGRDYVAMRVTGEQLGANDPFKLLADGVPGARDAMGMHTLIVVGATFADGPGFVLLDRHVQGDDTGHGTELQDRTCQVAAEGAS